MGYEKTTKPYKPFILIYSETADNRIEARKREKYWKSGVGKEKSEIPPVWACLPTGRFDSHSGY